MEKRALVAKCALRNLSSQVNEKTANKWDLVLTHIRKSLFWQISAMIVYAYEMK